MNSINRQYKDRLFRAIFGSAERKEYALALYNAVNGTSYENAEALQIYTIEDAVYLGMKDDVAFIFANMLSLYEQQSTLNPNMPLRGLLYLAKQYEKYVEDSKLNLYRTKLQKIPTPQYFVFYNGSEDQPEKLELRLSDAFLTNSATGTCLEVIATVLNINYGKNRALLENCKPLADYSRFVNCVRINQEAGLTLADAVDTAVDQAIAEDLLDGYFRRHKAEVIGMVLAEYDEEQTLKDWYEDGKEEGRVEGRAEGRAEGRVEGVQETLQKLSAALHLPKEKLQALLEETNLQQ